MLSNQDVRCIILKDTIIHHPLGPSHRRQLFSRLEDKQYCSMYFVNASEEDTCSRNQHRSMGIMPTCMHDTGIFRTENLPRHFIDRQCINIRSEPLCPARVFAFYSSD